MAELEVTLRVQRAGGRDFSLDVSFRAPPGITILFGPSGAGKSTTLAAIAGLLHPDAGRIALGDEVWFGSSGAVARPIEHRHVAFVFQSLALFPHLSAIENVAYGIDRKIEPAKRRHLAREMLARMKVEHLAERRPRT